MKLTQTIEEEYRHVESAIKKEVKADCEDCKLDLVPLYQKYLESRNCNTGPRRSAENIYHTCLHFLKKSKEEYAIQDINTFSLQYTTILGCTDHTDFGIFISALINKHFEETRTKKEYTVFINKEKSEISFLGMENEGANIQIVGSTGGFAGFYMKKGFLHISGDAGYKLGYEMSGGKIIVEKNADTEVGTSMKGGQIHIKGDAKDIIGSHMTNGIIKIDGEINALVLKNVRKEHAEIYHKGKNIFDKKKETMNKGLIEEKETMMQKIKKIFGSKK